MFLRLPPATALLEAGGGDALDVRILYVRQIDVVDVVRVSPTTLDTAPPIRSRRLDLERVVHEFVLLWVVGTAPATGGQGGIPTAPIHDFGTLPNHRLPVLLGLGLLQRVQRGHHVVPVPHLGNAHILQILVRQPMCDLPRNVLIHEQLGITRQFRFRLQVR